MLTIRTYLDRSAINGIGVFAAEAVAKDHVIWIYNPDIDITFRPHDWQMLQSSLATAAYEQICKYVYKENDLYILCTDNAQFMNHSASSANIINGQPTTLMLAGRDISPGEELLCNYQEFCDEDDFGLNAVRG